jgi:hypothetical protein
LKILCIIPALPYEVTLETLRSVWNQTVPVTQTLILTEKINEESTFPAKISTILNNGLTSIRLEEYDYLLRVDADTILPAKFIEAHLQQQPHLVGYGNAQLINMPAFIEVMDAKFFPEQDDDYIRFKFASKGKRVIDYTVSPNITRKECTTHQMQKYFVERGTILYSCGCEPFHLIYQIISDPRKA